MIRLVALACGVLCGLGLVLSGALRPSVLLPFVDPTGRWDPAFGMVVLVAAVSGGVVLMLVRALAGRRAAGPLLGGAIEPVAPVAGWKAPAGGLLFGLGMGVTGYVPLTALAAAGVFAPGAAVFLASVIGGMLLHDAVANRGGLARHSG